MSAIRTAPFELNVPSQALPANKVFFQDLGFPQQANLVLVSGTGGPLTVTYTDENGQTSPPITIQSGASYYTQNLVIRILTITGPEGATFAGAITWPRVVDPSDIVVSAITGKVSTSIDGQTVGVAPADTYAGTAVAPSLQDQLPAGLDTNGLFKIRYLGPSDAPNRGWNLTGTDVPSRSWTLGTTDTPTAYGSAGKAIQQDSLGNQYHVPVLAGTTTAINTKALQYDANGYPLHTIGNVTSQGGLIPSLNEGTSSSWNLIIAPSSTQYFLLTGLIGLFAMENQDGIAQTVDWSWTMVAVNQPSPIPSSITSFFGGTVNFAGQQILGHSSGSVSMVATTTFVYGIISFTAVSTSNATGSGGSQWYTLFPDASTSIQATLAQYTLQPQGMLIFPNQSIQFQGSLSAVSGAIYAAWFIPVGTVLPL